MEKSNCNGCESIEAGGWTVPFKFCDECAKKLGLKIGQFIETNDFIYRVLKLREKNLND